MVSSYGSRSEPRGATVGFKGALCRPRILRTVFRATWSLSAIWRTETPSTRPRRSTSATLPDGSTGFIASGRVVDHVDVSCAQIEAWTPGRVVPTQDLAYGPARHVKVAGDPAHGDALDQVESPHLGDVAGGVNGFHLDHTRRTSRRTPRKAPTRPRARRGGPGGGATGGRLIRVDQLACGGLESVAPLFRAEPGLAVGPGRNHSEYRLAAPE